MAEKKPVVVTVTGVAGNIGYASLFRIAAGGVWQQTSPLFSICFEITPALKAAGTAMELNDWASQAACRCQYH